MHHKAYSLLLLTSLLAQNRTYEVFFQQAYLQASSPNAPDSIDIYLSLRTLGASPPSAPDTLASSNFPFFYNTAVLNFSSARILYLNKFHNDNYYDPLTYTVSGGRVNVTIRRRIGFTAPGDTIASLDTLIGLRVPLHVCGPNLNSPLVWDSAPAAVLNSQLQSMKPRLTWTNDTLRVCPPLSASLTISGPSAICTDRPAQFNFSLTGSVLPDSFVIHVQHSSPSLVQVYPNITTPIPGGYTFSLIFPTSGTYTVEIYGVDKKCRCSIFLGALNNLMVYAPTPLHIYGPDSVYPGTEAVYTLSQTSAMTDWYLIAGSSSTYLGSGPSMAVRFDQSPTPPRVDTLLVRYSFSGNPCSSKVQKYVVVRACPSSGGSIVASSTTLCDGQSASLELTGLSAPPDSLRWQKEVGSTWTDILNEGSNPTLPLYLTPSLPSGVHAYRVKLYYGRCEVYSSPVTLTVSSSGLVREFYGMTSPGCQGDTISLNAVGPGIWLTPNGTGTFIDSTNPSGLYVVGLGDFNQVTICWVIRPEDTTLCRDRNKDTLCLQLTVNPTDAQGSFSINSANRYVCYGGRVRLRGEITSGAGGFWTTPNGNGVFYPSILVPEAYYIPDPRDVGSWVYISWVVLGTTCGGMVYTDSVYVESGTSIRISAPNQVCSGVALTLSAVPNRSDILWFRGSIERIRASGGFSTTNPYFLTTGSLYEAGRLPVGRDTFVVYLRQGTCESVDEFPVEVIPSPQAAFELSPRLTTMNNPRIRFISQSQGAVTHVWDFGDLNRLTTDASSREIEHVYSAPGVYSVVLYVENDLGCSDFYVCTDCIQILPRRVYLPNAFSPNGDGRNDSFRILPTEEGFYFTRLEIFDRWGQIVFAGDNISEWKGEGKDGQPLDAGAYTYRAVILIPDEGLFTYTGLVHIVR